jgi:cellulose synthase/poly-beta-1,6-N-acetylglucosamine synthase-like glycosyltransferase
MNEPSLWFLLVITTLIGLSQIGLALRCQQYLRQYQRQSARRLPNFTPPVALICPCKGLDDAFAANIQALLEFDYPNYSATFVVSSQADPAYEVLQRLSEPHAHAQLLVAEPSKQCGDKVNNQLAAVQNEWVRSAEVLVFVDSDGQPHRSWLRGLVAPLVEPDVGLTTGYRWYKPPSPNFWSWMRAVGNNVGLAPYLVISSDSAWGGAMAVRFKDFARSGITEIWARAIDDDLTLAQAIRRLGQRIVFVPDCLTISFSSCTFFEYFDWLLRQMFMAKIYNPVMWRLALVSLLPIIMMGLGFLLLIGSVSFPAIRLPALILLVVVPLQILGGILTALVFQDGKTAFWVPFGFLCSGSLSLAAFIASIFTNRITWRGITYEVRSCDEITIL